MPACLRPFFRRQGHVVKKYKQLAQSVSSRAVAGNRIRDLLIASPTSYNSATPPRQVSGTGGGQISGDAVRHPRPAPHASQAALHSQQDCRSYINHRSERARARAGNGGGVQSIANTLLSGGGGEYNAIVGRLASARAHATSAPLAIDMVASSGGRRTDRRAVGSRPDRADNGRQAPCQCDQLEAT